MGNIDSNKWILGLAAEKNWTAPKIAEICRVSLQTAQSWMRPAGTKAWRKAPDMAVELLALQTGRESPFAKE